MYPMTLWEAREEIIVSLEETLAAQLAMSEVRGVKRLEGGLHYASM